MCQTGDARAHAPSFSPCARARRTQSGSGRAAKLSDSALGLPLLPTVIHPGFLLCRTMSNNWYRPPPAPLDLPTPTYDDRPRSFPDFPAPDLFPLQLPVVQHSPLASPSAGGLSPPDSPGPPLKGLATKFAQMMGRGTSPVPPTSSSSSVGGVAIEPPLAPPAAPVDRPGHGYSKSVGQPASAFWDQLDERGLSGDEIERLAREERDWSRREAERLMALENQRLATGKRSATMATTPEAEDQTPRVSQTCSDWHIAVGI